MGTPGRVGSLLETGALQPGMMRTLVLDEADQLMTDSFSEDVRCSASGEMLAASCQAHRMLIALAVKVKLSS